MAHLTFQFVDKILWYDHSNETFSAVLLHATICFSIFYKVLFRIFLDFFFFFFLGGGGVLNKQEYFKPEIVILLDILRKKRMPL